MNTRQVYFNDTLLWEFSTPMEASIVMQRFAEALGFRGVHSEYTYYYSKGDDRIWSPEEEG